MDRYLHAIIRTFGKEDPVTLKPEEFQTKGVIDLQSIRMHYATHDNENNPTGVSIDWHDGGGVSIKMDYDKFTEKLTKYRNRAKMSPKNYAFSDFAKKINE